MKKQYIWAGIGLLAAAAASAYFLKNRSIPKGIQAVANFQKKRYLGKWYEIARFDFRFEKNMSHVTAEYSINQDGTIRVKNTGYQYKKRQQKQSVGKARFIGDDRIAMLEVSFFGPFYAGYNVIAIDEDYRYALVCGKNRNYLWLLSRDRTMPDTIKSKYLSIAQNAGFNTSELVWTQQ